MNIKRELWINFLKSYNYIENEPEPKCDIQYASKLEQIIADIWGAVDNYKGNKLGKYIFIPEIQQKIESIIKGVDNDMSKMQRSRSR
jgi:hypothetical protein